MTLITKLIEEGVIDSSQSISIQNSINEEGKCLDQILIEELNVDPEKLFNIKKDYFIGYETFHADNTFRVDENILSYIPLDTVKRFSMVPVEIDDNGYFVDKTLFIKEIWEDADIILLLTKHSIILLVILNNYPIDFLI